MSIASQKILVIDDEVNMCHMLATVLRKAGYAVDTAADGQAGLQKTIQQDYDYILCDVNMPVMNGMDFLRAVIDRPARSCVIMMSAYGSIDTAIDAMKHGAYDYISKPFKPDEVLLTLKKAEERESLKRENRRLKARIEEIEKDFAFGDMVGRSPGMSSVFELARKAARYSTTVLILGESGTGKELVARGIHNEGERAGKPLVPINCGGIPGDAARERAVRLQEGRVHRRRPQQEGPLSGSRRRHHIFGRDRRAAAVAAGEAPARSSGERGSAGRRGQGHAGGRARDRGDRKTSG